MSSTIWTRCAGPSELRALAARAWRMVEAQHRVATLKLVDGNLEDQSVLEDLLEASKPALPRDENFRGLHYLLATPFRYPPLRHGSRFGGRHERGIWYGSAAERTVMAEVAHARLRFIDATEADLGTIQSEHTLFHVPLATARGVDLTEEPFAEHRARISSPRSYRWSQALGSAMRAAEVEVAAFESARDLEGGVNYAVFAPAAFAKKTPGPRVPQVWTCFATRTDVVFHRIDLLGGARFAFGREIMGSRDS